MPLEKTLALLKPDAVRNGKADEICERIQQEGFRIVQRKVLTLTRERAEQFYDEHKERGFFGELVEFMSSGPINALILEKEGGILGWRALMGPTNTFKAKEEEPNCLRALYGTDLTQNATHGSDSPESAARELQFFFPSGVKLYYWPIGGRASAIRIALFMSGTEFDDFRFPFDQTPAMVESGIAPFKSFPVLEVDGEVFAQTNSMLRYIGRPSNLYPSDPLDALTVDMVMESVEDMYRAIGSTFGLKGDLLIQARTKLYQTTLPPYFKQFETVIAGKYLLGNQISVGDLKLGFVLSWLTGGILDHVPPTCIDAYPKTKGLMNAVMSHPKVVEWNEANEKKK